VLVAILGIASFTSRRDGLIEASATLIEALPDARREGTALPLRGPTLCGGPTLSATSAVVDPAFRDGVFIVCGHDALGTLGFRVNHELDHPARPFFRIDGNVHLGGPLAMTQGVILHRAADRIFWTSSRKEAGRISRSPVPSAVVFGHARWGPGQLNAEIEAGAWEVQDASVLPGDEL
jgi:putative AlgH/UPF0301 family transcriptional regulator